MAEVSTLGVAPPPPPKVTTKERLLRVAKSLREIQRECEALGAIDNDALYRIASDAKNSLERVEALLDLLD